MLCERFEIVFGLLGPGSATAAGLKAYSRHRNKLNDIATGCKFGNRVTFKEDLITFLVEGSVTTAHLLAANFETLWRSLVIVG